MSHESRPQTGSTLSGQSLGAHRVRLAQAPLARSVMGTEVEHQGGRGVGGGVLISKAAGRGF